VIDPKLSKDVKTITLSYTFLRGRRQAFPPEAEIVSDPLDQGDGLREASRRKASFLQTMKAVAWSFLRRAQVARTTSAT